MDRKTQATTLALQRDGGLSRNQLQMHARLWAQVRWRVFEPDDWRQHTQRFVLPVAGSTLRTRWQRLTGRGRDGARQSEDDQMSSQRPDPIQIPLD